MTEEKIEYRVVVLPDDPAIKRATTNPYDKWKPKKHRKSKISLNSKSRPTQG